MSAKSVSRQEIPEAACGIGPEGFKCAIVSWVAPLIAAVILVAGLHYPVVSGFNILAVAFGITATLRSLAHIRRFGNCGIGGHVVVGVFLNFAVVGLLIVYLFTGSDPLGLKP